MRRSLARFVHQHKTLRVPHAMAAGAAKTMWSVDELLAAAIDGEVAQ